MSKLAINQRFIQSVNFIISEKEKNKSTIAENIEISKSKFSEILNGRMNVGIEQIILFSESYNVSLDYILTGTGGILRVSGETGLSQPKVATSEEKIMLILDELREKVDLIYTTTLKEIAKTQLDGLENDLDKNKKNKE